MAWEVVSLGGSGGGLMRGFDPVVWVPDFCWMLRSAYRSIFFFVRISCGFFGFFCGVFIMIRMVNLLFSFRASFAPCADLGVGCYLSR